MVQPTTGPLAECWFLDVGQGTSNVILLGNGRAIVVDCGPKANSVPLQLLRRHVETIEVLILSHNDADHDGGAARIIAAYPRAIKQIFFLSDRPAQCVRTYRLIEREKAANHLLCQPKRLEVRDSPQSVYSDSELDIDLRLFYPTFAEALRAEQTDAGRPNACCGVLALFCGRRNIVFSGDATMEAWEAIASRLVADKPLQCEVMTGPHHGAHMTHKRGGEKDEVFQARENRALNRLYGEIIQPRVVVVSVGSSNRNDHPKPSTISKLNELGIGVICTQITPHCSDDLESVRPGVLRPVFPSASSAERQTTASSGRSKNVACAGSVVAEISPDRVLVARYSQHRRRVDEGLTAGKLHPLCRAT